MARTSGLLVPGVCVQRGTKGPREGSLENRSSVWGQGAALAEFSSPISTPTTATRSVFGQNSASEAGYEAGREEPVQYSCEEMRQVPQGAFRRRRHAACGRDREYGRAERNANQQTLEKRGEKEKNSATLPYLGLLLEKQSPRTRTRTRTRTAGDC